MGQTIRFGVSLNSELLEKFDALCEEKSYQTRSEAIRDLIRGVLVQKEWEQTDMVRDTGIGIPKVVQDRIFEEFELAEPFLTKRVSGAGLGLSIARHLVEMLGGMEEVGGNKGVYAPTEAIKNWLRETQFN